ncbi:MAG: hypothetical protein ACR2L3_02255 [Actinomycetota bacterium]
MDEAVAREHAEAHGRATVAGDMKSAGSDLAPEGMSKAGAVMTKMPKELIGSSIESVIIKGDIATVRIRYLGTDEEISVDSDWEERDGRPKIVDLRVV